MIALVIAMQMAANQPERCEAVRHDHEQLKAWAKSNLEQLESSRNGTPSSADRARWDAFEKKVEATIGELNRRYAQCRKD